ncbi:hypothetical protein EC957_002064 [Mortierella hygrophila]|uniref:Protein phosphatase methylesterase 1 n=1 Tax=Mortierella hygrophila TaxID=979708 RepID=A0A9P6K7H5_9FUNG|nr:hypothetical protein EC957_002064 [Mortierella hygrophila]
MTDYEPLDWPAYFQSKRRYAIPPQKDPTNIVYTLYESNAGRKHLPVIVLIHGAGHCARSFALVAQALHASHNLSLHARILCPDLRGHGETTSDDQTNLDLENLAQDLETLLLSLYGDNDGRYLDKAGKEIGRGPPNIHLIGHSMGGSIVTEVAYRNRVPNISSLFVLDMAEANGHAAPRAIRAWCEARPPVCRTITQAIKWGVESGTVRNILSARISFPGMIAYNPTALIPATPSTNPTHNPNNPPEPTMGGFTWRTDLLASEHHCPSWFRNQNHKFLSSVLNPNPNNNPQKVPKMLIFAEHSRRLDTELSSARLEGRFEFLRILQVGHAVQEDDPEAVTNALIQYWQELGVCFKPLPKHQDF